MISKARACKGAHGEKMRTTEQSYINTSDIHQTETQKQTHTFREQTGGCQRGVGSGMGEISEEDHEYKLPVLK